MNKVYEIITNKIIQNLNKGQIPWQKPWTSELPMNISGRPYRGLNVFMLQTQGFSSPYWLTFKQTRQMGGCVNAGEKATPIIYWNMFERETNEKDSGGKPVVETIPFLRYYSVFNTNQVTGIEVPELDNNEDRTFTPIEAAEDIVDNMPKRPEIKHNGYNACYYPDKDYVEVPKPENFKKDVEYYATLFHELVHSTGHKSRVGRKGISVPTSFGGYDYSKEELIAEFGSAFLCGICKIEKPVIKNQSAYIQSWIEKMEKDNRLVIFAAQAAQKAADFILDRKDEDDIPKVAILDSIK